jgi:hypothetical protein
MQKLTRRTIVYLTITATLIAIVTLMTYYWAYVSFISIFVTDALWASVLLTIVLVIVNISTTMQNRVTIREMEKARKAAVMPNVKAKLVWIGATQVALKLKNYGVGPAMDLKAEISFLPANIKKNWTDNIFSPNQSIKLWLPNGGDTHKMSSSIAQIIIKGEYSDVFGQKFQLNESIDTQKIIDEVSELKILTN